MELILRALFGRTNSYDITSIEVGKTTIDEALNQFGRPDSITVMGDRDNTLTEYIWCVTYKVFMSIEFDSSGRVTRKYLRNYL